MSRSRSWSQRSRRCLQGLDNRPRSRGRPRDLISMASVSVLVSAAHVPVSVLVSEVPALSTGSREPASVSRPASRPNLDGLGLGLGLGHPCLGLGLGLGGPGLDYNPGIHTNNVLIHNMATIARFNLQTYSNNQVMPQSNGMQLSTEETHCFLN